MFIAVLFTIAQIQNINVHQQKNGKRGGGILIYNGMLLSQKKQGHFDICNNMDGSGGIMSSETGHVEK